MVTFQKLILDNRGLQSSIGTLPVVIRDTLNIISHLDMKFGSISQYYLYNCFFFWGKDSNLHSPFLPLGIVLCVSPQDKQSLYKVGTDRGDEREKQIVVNG